MPSPQFSSHCTHTHTLHPNRIAPRNRREMSADESAAAAVDPLLLLPLPDSAVAAADGSGAKTAAAAADELSVPAKKKRGRPFGVAGAGE